MATDSTLDEDTAEQLGTAIDLYDLQNALENVEWNRVPGISALTASGFSTLVQEAIDELEEPGKEERPQLVADGGQEQRRPAEKERIREYVESIFAENPDLLLDADNVARNVPDASVEDTREVLKEMASSGQLHVFYGPAEGGANGE